MQYLPEHIRQIVHGTKTQTRRIVKDGDYANFISGYEVETKSIDAALNQNGLKWQVGNDYAVSPGRGQRGAWWCPEEKAVTWHIIRDDMDRAYGWRPLRICITAIRQERVQDISEADARAEGWPTDEDKRECPHCDALYPTGWYDGPQLPCFCNPVTWYRNTWDSINTRKGTRWADNPLVFVLSFEVVKS